MKNRVRRFNENIDPYGEEIWDDKKLYKIYTSRNGEIEFGKQDLEPYGIMNNVYFFNRNFILQYVSLQNHMEVRVDLNRMFVFIETNYGDSAEYKIFNI